MPTSTRTASPRAPSGSGIYTPLIQCALRSRCDEARRRRRRGVLFFASAALAPAAADPVHQRRLGEDPASSPSRRRPARAPQAVLDRTIEAEDDHPADPDVELVQTSIPGEGDTSFQILQSAAQRAARQQRDDDGPPEVRRSTSTRPDDRARDGPRSRSRPTATTSRCPRPPASASNGLNVIVSRRRPRPTSTRRPRPSSLRSRTSPTSPTSRATSSRRRPRSRSPSTRTRPSRSG